ncbi:protein P200-like isoform X3 [Uranotaenia lowii]|uniref:protein P200-like isoform X3 n=1 Tax=Uranotaenia lowii TaxID=190385 RepID=UPI002479FEA9|nr:protein P200-like isoform X3 [Uranotaenia lowii]
MATTVNSRRDSGSGATMGPRKTMIIMVTVVGCIAILWPKVFYPMLVGPTQTKNVVKDHRGAGEGCCGVVLDQETFANVSINAQNQQNLFRKRNIGPAVEDLSIRQERPPHLRPETMHPAMRERGRAIPHVGSVHSERPQAAPRIVEGRPGPIPGMRPPMGAGSHQPTKSATSMGFIMPLYTIGIVSFFIYTILKLVFKKTPAAPYPEIKPDPAFRDEVFTTEQYIKRPDSGNTKHGQPIPLEENGAPVSAFNGNVNGSIYAHSVQAEISVDYAQLSAANATAKEADLAKYDEVVDNRKTETKEESVVDNYDYVQPKYDPATEKVVDGIVIQKVVRFDDQGTTSTGDEKVDCATEEVKKESQQQENVIEEKIAVELVESVIAQTESLLNASQNVEEKASCEPKEQTTEETITETCHIESEITVVKEKNVTEDVGKTVEVEQPKESSIQSEENIPVEIEIESSTTEEDAIKMIAAEMEKASHESFVAHPELSPEETASTAITQIEETTQARSVVIDNEASKQALEQEVTDLSKKLVDDVVENAESYVNSKIESEQDELPTYDPETQKLVDGVVINRFATEDLPCGESSGKLSVELEVPSSSTDAENSELSEATSQQTQEQGELVEVSSSALEPVEEPVCEKIENVQQVTSAPILSFEEKADVSSGDAQLQLVTELAEETKLEPTHDSISSESTILEEPTATLVESVESSESGVENRSTESIEVASDMQLETPPEEEIHKEEQKTTNVEKCETMIEQPVNGSESDEKSTKTENIEEVPISGDSPVSEENTQDPPQKEETLVQGENIETVVYKVLEIKQAQIETEEKQTAAIGQALEIVSTEQNEVQNETDAEKTLAEETSTSESFEIKQESSGIDVKEDQAQIEKEQNQTDNVPDVSEQTLEKVFIEQNEAQNETEAEKFLFEDQSKIEPTESKQEVDASFEVKQQTEIEIGAPVAEKQEIKEQSTVEKPLVEEQIVSENVVVEPLIDSVFIETTYQDRVEVLREAISDPTSAADCSEQAKVQDALSDEPSDEVEPTTAVVPEEIQTESVVESSAEPVNEEASVSEETPTESVAEPNVESVKEEVKEEPTQTGNIIETAAEILEPTVELKQEPLVETIGQVVVETVVETVSTEKVSELLSESIAASSEIPNVETVEPEVKNDQPTVEVVEPVQVSMDFTDTSASVSQGTESRDLPPEKLETAPAVEPLIENQSKDSVEVNTEASSEDTAKEDVVVSENVVDFRASITESQETVVESHVKANENTGEAADTVPEAIITTETFSDNCSNEPVFVSGDEYVIEVAAVTSEEGIPKSGSGRPVQSSLTQGPTIEEVIDSKVEFSEEGKASEEHIIKIEVEKTDTSEMISEVVTEPIVVSPEVSRATSSSPAPSTTLSEIQVVEHFETVEKISQVAVEPIVTSPEVSRATSSSPIPNVVLAPALDLIAETVEETQTDIASESSSKDQEVQEKLDRTLSEATAVACKIESIVEHIVTEKIPNAVVDEVSSQATESAPETVSEPIRLSETAAKVVESITIEDKSLATSSVTSTVPASSSCIADTNQSFVELNTSSQTNKPETSLVEPLLEAPSSSSPVIEHVIIESAHALENITGVAQTSSENFISIEESHHTSKMDSAPLETPSNSTTSSSFSTPDESETTRYAGSGHSSIAISSSNDAAIDQDSENTEQDEEAKPSTDSHEDDTSDEIAAVERNATDEEVQETKEKSAKSEVETEPVDNETHAYDRLTPESGAVVKKRDVSVERSNVKVIPMEKKVSYDTNKQPSRPDTPVQSVTLKPSIIETNAPDSKCVLLDTKVQQSSKVSVSDNELAVETLDASRRIDEESPFDLNLVVVFESLSNLNQGRSLELNVLLGSEPTTSVVRPSPAARVASPTREVVLSGKMKLSLVKLDDRDNKSADDVVTVPKGSKGKKSSDDTFGPNEE